MCARSIEYEAVRENVYLSDADFLFDLFVRKILGNWFGVDACAADFARARSRCENRSSNDENRSLLFSDLLCL